MGTNYYRIPKASEIIIRYQKMFDKIGRMDIWNVSDISNLYSTIHVNEFERTNPWNEFTDGLKIHVGKRSSGWKFLWNFQDGKFYSSKKELLTFIRSGRVVDEYGELQDTEEFIKMALEWGQPDGNIVTHEYISQNMSFISDKSGFTDKEVDGLRVSPVREFS
jgi:hypothetical protein